MSTGIQWTDETWNPVVGCERVSPGCAHCYAKALHDMRHKATLAGKSLPAQYAVPFESVQVMPDRLTYPLGWRKPRRIFVNSVSDLFHDDVPERFIDRVFAVMAIASQHTFQVLTKRPARMLAYMRGLARSYDRLEAAARSVDYTIRFEGIPLVPWPLPNVWLGVSVENQRWADERIPLLMRTPAAVRFLSCEPLLEPVHVPQYLTCRDRSDPQFEVGHGIDWIIVGGESGPKARPFDVQWARDLIAQCREDDRVRTAPFVKQLGRFPYDSSKAVPGQTLAGLSLRDRHGGDLAEWPEELRVREFPASGVR